MDNLVFEYSDETLNNLICSGVENIKAFDGKNIFVPFVNYDTKNAVMVCAVEKESIVLTNIDNDDLTLVVPIKGNENFSKSIFMAHKNHEDPKLGCLEFAVRVKDEFGEHTIFVSHNIMCGTSVSDVMPGDYVLSPHPQPYSIFEDLMKSIGYVRKGDIYVNEGMLSKYSREELFEQWLDNNGGHVAVDSILMNAWMAGYEAGMRYGEKAK